MNYLKNGTTLVAVLSGKKKGKTKLLTSSFSLAVIPQNNMEKTADRYIILYHPHAIHSVSKKFFLY